MNRSGRACKFDDLSDLPLCVAAAITWAAFFTASLAAEHVMPSLGPSAEDGWQKLTPKVRALIEKTREGDASTRRGAAHELGIMFSTLPRAIGRGTVKHVWDRLFPLDPEENRDYVRPDVRAVTKTLVDLIRGDDVHLRCEAMDSLSRIGWEARAAVPALIEAMHSPHYETRRVATMHLRRFGPAARQAVPVLIAQLSEEEPEIQCRSIATLGSIGSGAVSAVPELVRLTRAEHIGIRDRAVRALGRIGVSGSTAIPALTRALSDLSPTIRSAAAVSLSAYEENALPAVPALVVALRDKEGMVRANAAGCLGSIGPKAKEAVPELLDALRADVDSRVAERAADALGHIGGPAIRVLAESLGDRDSAIRVRAAMALGSAEKGAEGAVPELIEALRDGDLALRRRAASALSRVGPGARAAVPVLTEALSSEDWGIRWNALMALGAIGSRAKPTVPAIIKMMERDPSLTKEAIGSLARLGPAAEEAVPAALASPAILGPFTPWWKDTGAARFLKKFEAAAVTHLVMLLQSEEQEERGQAAMVLAHLGSQPEAVVPVLARALADGNHGDKMDLAYSLAAVGTAASAAVPQLCEAFDAPSPEVKMHVAYALGKIGPEAKLSVPALAQAMGDPSPIVRILAAEAVWRIAGRVGGIRVISDHLRHEDPVVRKSAAKLLGRIGTDARSATAALKTATEDNDAMAARCASWAMERISATQGPRRSP